nr:MAG TPA: hypothetical protein [Caudoviricetes sp.]
MASIVVKILKLTRKRNFIILNFKIYGIWKFKKFTGPKSPIILKIPNLENFKIFRIFKISKYGNFLGF